MTEPEADAIHQAEHQAALHRPRSAPWLNPFDPHTHPTRRT